MILLPKGPTILSKEQVHNLVLTWLAEDCLPFTTVESRVLPLLLSSDALKYWPTAQQTARLLQPTTENIEKKVKAQIKVYIKEYKLNIY